MYFVVVVVAVNIPLFGGISFANLASKILILFTQKRRKKKGKPL